MTNPIGNLQGNIARLEDVGVVAEGVKNSLNAQISQDQEAFVAAITARFEQTMQDSLAASEARQNAIIDGLRAENALLKKEMKVLKTTLEEKLATKVDQSHFDGHWHGFCNSNHGIWSTTKRANKEYD